MLVEGIRIKGKPFSKKQLKEIWKTLSMDSFPKVKALIVSKDSFNKILEKKHCIEDDFREIEEWGRLLSANGTDACVFNADKNENVDFIILVRENHYHSLKKILLHELSHIVHGDL